MMPRANGSARRSANVVLVLAALLLGVAWSPCGAGPAFPFRFSHDREEYEDAASFSRQAVAHGP